MIQDKHNPTHWTADEGKTFIRKIDNFDMGEDMCLGIFIDGTKDTIDNYIEVDINNGNLE